MADLHCAVLGERVSGQAALAEELLAWRLIIVGCTGSMSGPQAAASCYLVQADTCDKSGQQHTYNLVLDLGPGGLGQLMRYICLDDISLVFLSHTHPDHVADLTGLEVYRHWHLSQPAPPLPVAGPGDLAARLRGLSGEEDPNEDFSRYFHFLSITGPWQTQLGPLHLQVLPVNHNREAYGIRISGGGRTLMYTGDTDSCENLLILGDGADLILSEAAFITGVDTARGVHLTGQRAAQMAQEAGAKQLVITHVQPWTDAQVPLLEAQQTWPTGKIVLAAAGQVWEL